MIVGILGENPRSEALATLVAQAGHIPKIGKESNSPTPIRGFQGTQQWSHLVVEADLVVITANALDIASHLKRACLRPRNQVLVLPGIEAETGLWMSEYVQHHSHALRVGVLNGAISVNDIKQDRPTAVVVGSVYNSIGTLGRDVFHSDICRVYYSSDPIGIEVASMFSNVVHFAIGIADQFDKGTATIGAVSSRGLIEGARLAEILGAEEHSFLGLSGVGNIVSELRNSPAYHEGRTHSKQTPLNEVLLSEFKHLLRLNQLQRHPVDLPLTEAMVAIGMGTLDPETVMDKLMRRKATSE
jgi:glycerol-3-phosphate dehydrogenase (NAD(P)+)